MHRHIFAMMLGFAAIATPALAADDCPLTRITSVDMTPDAYGRVSVPMTLGGQDIKLLVDTGGLISTLTEPTVDALGLTRLAVGGGQIIMYGGGKITHYVEARDMALGQLKGPRKSFLVSPKNYVGGLNGTLGPDILKHYDDEFDFTAGRFSLYMPDHCPGRVVYWTQTGSAAIAMELDDDGHIHLPLMLDGKEVRFLVDTGAARSVLSLELAQKLFGFDDKSPDLALVGPRDNTPAYRYPFKTLTFGGENGSGIAIAAPDILLVPDAVSHLSHADSGIIGIGVLRKLHLYIAYRERKLYVTAADAH